MTARMLMRLAAAPKWAALFVLVAALTLAAPGGTLAAPAPQPATIASAFVPASIRVGGTSSLSITITNPNASTTLTGVAFTDTLPTGLVVDNPNGATGNCGGGTLTAISGGGTIGLTGGKLAGGASCQLSADVTAAKDGKYANATGPVSATQTVTPPYSIAGSGQGGVQTLTVSGYPTIRIAAPLEHAVFAFGQKVRAHYRCTDVIGGPGLADCSGDVADGALLDTRSPGPQTFTVTALGNDGAVVSDTVDYTVLPDNVVKLLSTKSSAAGRLTVSVKVPGPGKVSLALTADHVRFSRLTRKLARAGVLRLTLAPGAAGSNLLSRLSAGGATGTIAGRLAITFKPKGGKPGRLTVGGLKLRY